jgi:acyl-CoA thioester hydrolase
VPEVFRRSSEVRFSDTDAMGHVNHARFLGYFEDARVALIVEAFALRNPVDLAVILARAEIDYLRPVRYGGGAVDVAVWLTRVGTRSFTLDYALEQQGEVAARGRTTMVAYDYAAARSRPLTETEIAALRRHAGVAPDGA